MTGSIVAVPCKRRSSGHGRAKPALTAILLGMAITLATSATAHPAMGSRQILRKNTLAGNVVDTLGKPVPGANVTLHFPDNANSLHSLTDPLGSFSFTGLPDGRYELEAVSQGVTSSPTAVTLSGKTSTNVHLVLGAAKDGSASVPSSQSSAAKEMEFSDKPDFTVAGVTDWTAVGGHGSDATLRTSESLARETLTLQASPKIQTSQNELRTKAPEARSESALRAAFTAAPQSYTANRDLGEYYLRSANYRQALPLLQAAFEINHEAPDDEYNVALACDGLDDPKSALGHTRHALAGKESAKLHRLAGELEEKLGDPLAAVQELRRAAEMDASEDNFLAWGSELLLHRAVWQAAEVYQNGVKAYPASAKLKTAWGAALFSGALYDRAADQLCEASDLDPGNAETYAFMGKIELAAPAPLPCIEQRLARFVAMHPESADANYLYAMALAKSNPEQNRAHVERLLTTAVSLDPKYSDAYLQLGILSFAQHRYPEAISFYTKAVETDPKQGEAHYRLALAYDRVGEGNRAKDELRIHDEIAKAQAEDIEQQRRQIKQFLVVQQGQSNP